VQNTLQEAHDRIDAPIRNQQRHHDKDMRALYDRMTTFGGEGSNHLKALAQTPQHSGMGKRR